MFCRNPVTFLRLPTLTSPTWGEPAPMGHSPRPNQPFGLLILDPLGSFASGERQSHRRLFRISGFARNFALQDNKRKLFFISTASAYSWQSGRPPGQRRRLVPWSLQGLSHPLYCRNHAWFPHVVDQILQREMRGGYSLETTVGVCHRRIKQATGRSRCI